MAVAARHQALRSRPIVVAICWLASLQVIPAELVVASAWTGGGYNFATRYISDLGNSACTAGFDVNGSQRYVCSPWHAAMNASFTASGVLVVLGLAFAWPRWPRRCTTVVAWLMLVVSGMCIVVIGLVPENEGPRVHSMAGLVLFVLANTAMILLGLGTRLERPALAAFSMCCGLVGIAGTYLGLSDHYLGIGAGSIERLTLDPFALWLLIVGVWLAWAHRRHKYVRRPARTAIARRRHAHR